MDDVDDEFRKVDWWKADILRIYDCQRLEIDLRKGRDNFADYFHDKVLIIENIQELDVFEFTVGEDSAIGTVSMIYFYNWKWFLYNFLKSVQPQKIEFFYKHS